MFDDILPTEKQSYEDAVLYDDLITLLNEVKLVHGGQALNSTLLRHKKVYNFLVKYQKNAMIDLEGKITDNLHCRIS